MGTHSSAQQSGESSRRPDEVALPAPTAWPLVLAFGFTLLFTGLLTNASLSILGLVLTLAGCAGWFRQVLPREQEEVVPLFAEELRSPLSASWLSGSGRARSSSRLASTPNLSDIGRREGRIGGKRGDGGAGLHLRVLKAGSIWYPINLLAATSIRGIAELGPSQLNSFHFGSFVIAVVLHGIGIHARGLALRRHVSNVSAAAHLLGGLIAPVLWSGLIYSIWICSIQCSQATSIGSGSWLPRWRSA